MHTNPEKANNLAKIPKRDFDREAKLIEIERESIANFTGDLGDLEAALGMLRMGDHFGWKVLVLIHNKRTIKKYEDILDIKVREFFPEEGACSERSVGYSFIKKVGNFWKAVSGDFKIENRRMISDSTTSEGI